MYISNQPHMSECLYFPLILNVLYGVNKFRSYERIFFFKQMTHEVGENILIDLISCTYKLCHLQSTVPFYNNIGLATR